MNKQALSKIAEQMRFVASKASVPGSGSLSNFRMHDGVGYSLENDASITFNAIVTKILRHKEFSQKFSAKYIENHIC